MILERKILEYNFREIILYIYQFESRTFRAKIPRASL